MKFGNPFSRSAFHASLPFLGRGAVLLVGLVVILGIVITAFVKNGVARTAVTDSILRVAGTDLPRDENGFINILLLGVGDSGHDGADLTDTMILASIDPTNTRSVVLLSLPRDLLIDSAEQTVSGRINAIYANEKRRLIYREKIEEDAAADLALQSVGDIIGEKLGVTIHGIVKADFTAFTLVVDALGGVDIDVPEAITDYTYPIAEDQTGLFQVEKGLQHFDGETALKYARSRHSTSDFDRSARQQLLLSALGGKVRSLPHTQQLSFVLDAYKMLQGHVVTTFNGPQLLALGQIASMLSRERMITAQLNFSVGGDGAIAAAGGFVIPAPPEFYSGASVLVPLASPGMAPDWGHIQAFVTMLLQHRSAYLSGPKLALIDAGANNLEVHRLRNELLRYNWNALDDEPLTATGTDLGDGQYSGVFFRENKFESAAELMGQLLSLPVARTETTGSGDVLLLLGESFDFKNFRTLSGTLLP